MRDLSGFPAGSTVGPEEFETMRKTVPRWLELDPNALSGRVSDRPTRQDIDINLNEALVVEYYSR